MFSNYNVPMAKKSIISHIVTIAKTVAPAVVTQRVYNKMFNHRFTAKEPFAFNVYEFPGLNRERHEFLSNKKNKLVGYIYFHDDKPLSGVFVFAHGYGEGGHRLYLDLINSICMHGYAVFAYDATAYDESEGKSMKGFTQGLLDADRAITYIETLTKEKRLPIYLCGHSWGAYSVSTALSNHPSVKGLISFSGFNSATTIFKENGQRYAGKKADDFMIYVDTYEKLLFGEISEATAVDAFANSNAKIVIVHSKDDETVPISAGYNIYKKEFGKNPRFKFIKLTSSGHGTVYYTEEGRSYYERLYNSYQKYQKKNPDSNDNMLYITEHIDRQKLTSLVDEKLIDKCISFLEK